VAAGVALFFAVQVSNTSLTASIDQLTKGLLGGAHMQLVARDSHGFEERIADVIARDPDVRAAAPVLMVQVNAAGPGGERPATLIGADARVVRLGGNLLRGFGSDRLNGLDAAVVPAPMARGLAVRFGD